MIINEQGGVLVVDNVRTVLFGVGGLPGTQDLSGLLVKSANLSDLTSASTARTNLGLGTAATRTVGQSAGNVLELSASGIVSLVGLEIYDTTNQGYASIRLQSDTWTLGTTTSAGISFGTSSDYNLLINGGNISGNRTYTLPDVSGTIALLSQVGDRYLTSSTTSNTISNGAKTFTVGTGLAYSPTQDITIVFDASNHMHAAVTSYNSTTGVLVVDVNHNTGSGTYAVWTVNVGGIGAGAIPSGGTTGQVLAKLSNTNYDDAWVTPTVAVGGITGLGTGVATALAIAVGGAPASLVLRDSLRSSITLPTNEGTSVNTGSGASLAATASFGRIWCSAGAGLSTALRKWNSSSFGVGVSPGVAATVINYSRPLELVCLFDAEQSTTNGIIRVLIGKAETVAVGALGNSGFGFEQRNYALWGVCHDGTTLTEVNLNTTTSSNVRNRVSAFSDGAGNITWFVNGTQVGTSALGPTGTTAATRTVTVETTNGGDTGGNILDYSAPIIISP